MWNENTHWTKCFLNTHWNAPEWRVQLLHTAYKVDYLKESFQDDKLNKFNFDIFTGVKRTASLKSLRLRDLLTVLTFGYLTFPYLPYGSWVFNLTVPYLALLGLTGPDIKQLMAWVRHALKQECPWIDFIVKRGETPSYVNLLYCILTEIVGSDQ